MSCSGHGEGSEETDGNFGTREQVRSPRGTHVPREQTPPEHPGWRGTEGTGIPRVLLVGEGLSRGLNSVRERHGDGRGEMGWEGMESGWKWGKRGWIRRGEELNGGGDGKGLELGGKKGWTWERETDGHKGWGKGWKRGGKT